MTAYIDNGWVESDERRTHFKGYFSSEIGTPGIIKNTLISFKSLRKAKKFRYVNFTKLGTRSLVPRSSYISVPVTR